MCGIAGFVEVNRATDAEPMIRSMLRIMAHRGPDAEGVWADASVALGHCRLSIIDLSSAGNQPMHYKGLTIVYNGEVYNYLEVKAALTALGHEFVSNSDTEVILHAYEQWGEECLARMAGMWAFALYDRPGRRVLLARDRFGIKPLYFHQHGGRVLFASEIKALLAAGVEAKVDASTLATYLVAGFEDIGSATFFGRIRQLLPGQMAALDVSRADLTFRQYYTLSEHVDGNRTGEEYYSVLEDSIRLHLRSDVEVGTCLSGGLDSSTVAAMAAGHYMGTRERRFVAVTAQSESAENDETHFAKMVVDRCGLEWHVVRPSYEVFSQEVERCLWFHDEPVGGPSVFLQYLVMKVARAAGVKVMLDGQGGDETLLGYERYYPAFFRELLRGGDLLGFGRELYLATRHSRLNPVLLGAYMVYFSCAPLRRRVLARRSAFLDNDFREEGMRSLAEVNDGQLDLHRLQCAEITKTQLTHLLRYEDRNSMASSIEARVPFLHHQCVEAAVGLATREKVRDGFLKFVLRTNGGALLPDEILWRRRKIGFEAPAAAWFARHMGVMQSAVEGSEVLRQVCKRTPRIELLNDDLKWRLYNVAVWERQANALW